MSCPCCHVMSGPELAARTGLTEAQLVDMVSAGVLAPPLRIGNQNFWSVHAVVHLLRTGVPHDECGGEDASSTLDDASL